MWNRGRRCVVGLGLRRRAGEHEVVVLGAEQQRLAAEWIRWLEWLELAVTDPGEDLALGLRFGEVEVWSRSGFFAEPACKGLCSLLHLEHALCGEMWQPEAEAEGCHTDQHQHVARVQGSRHPAGDHGGYGVLPWGSVKVPDRRSARISPRM